jgi:hypothetical protein
MNCLWHKGHCEFGECSSADESACTLVRKEIHLLQMCQFNTATSKCEEIFNCSAIKVASKSDPTPCTLRSCVLNNTGITWFCELITEDPTQGLPCSGKKTNCAGYDKGNSAYPCYVNSAGLCDRLTIKEDCPYLTIN